MHSLHKTHLLCLRQECQRIGDPWMLTYSALVAQLYKKRYCYMEEDTVSAPLHFPTLSLAFFHLKFPPSAGSKDEVESVQWKMLGHRYIWGSVYVFPAGPGISFPVLNLTEQCSVTLFKNRESLCLYFPFLTEWELSWVYLLMIS